MLRVYSEKKNLPIYLADITKQEIKNIGFTVLKAVIPGYIDLDIDYNFKQTKYSRLKMYAQPDMLDVLFRWIYVDKATFSNFITNLLLFDAEGVKDSAKAVFLR